MSCLNIHTDKDAIMNVMSKQEKDWNDGNIEAFMQGYWQSDSLMFIGKNGIKYGWENTLNNYKKSYPNKALMGKLKFKVLKLSINRDEAYMLGSWYLTRGNDSLNGYFTLYWKKINGNWLITIDHTS